MLKKRYVSNHTQCKVSFTLPAEIEAKSACLVGDFNNWDRGATPMKQLKDGSWKAEVSLKPGQEYQFRYLVNDQDWHNDSAADRYVAGPYGGENSVVST